jgi:hypothetical protein
MSNDDDKAKEVHEFCDVLRAKVDEYLKVKGANLGDIKRLLTEDLFFQHEKEQHQNYLNLLQGFFDILAVSKNFASNSCNIYTSILSFFESIPQNIDDSSYAKETSNFFLAIATQRDEVSSIIHVIDKWKGNLQVFLADLSKTFPTKNGKSSQQYLKLSTSIVAFGTLLILGGAGLIAVQAAAMGVAPMVGGGAALVGAGLTKASDDLKTSSESFRDAVNDVEQKFDKLNGVENELIQIQTQLKKIEDAKSALDNDAKKYNSVITAPHRRASVIKYCTTLKNESQTLLSMTTDLLDDPQAKLALKQRIDDSKK